MRHRYGNERVETVEIGRREPNRPPSRSGESGIAGIIDPAPHYRLLVAQHSQLLSARAVELNQSLDRGHLEQQQLIVRPRCFTRRCAFAGWKANLSFDLLAELLNSPGHRIGLLRLSLR